MFGHINGFGGGDEELSDFPFQPSLGVFNETNLRRYDLVLDELSKAKPLYIAVAVSLEGTLQRGVRLPAVCLLMMLGGNSCRSASV